MKRVLLFIALLVLLASIHSFAENILSEFSKDLAELQSLNLQMSSFSQSILPGQQLSAADNRRLEELMKKAVEWIRKMLEKYKNSPVKISGFSISFPLGIAINFDIIIEKL